MTATLATEAARIDKDLSRILRQTSVSAEAPLRMTIRDVDAGGAPELSPALLRYIGPVCECGRPAQCAVGCRATRPDEHLAACERACPSGTSRFHRPDHKANPNRLKRSLRQIRKLNPKAYDLVYLIVGLHFSFEAACARVNSSNLERGKPEHSPAEFAVLWVSGASMLTASW